MVTFTLTFVVHLPRQLVKGGGEKLCTEVSLLTDPSFYIEFSAIIPGLPTDGWVS